MFARAYVLLLAVAAAAPAEDLLYLGLNARGAEEWYRLKDHATVIRVPGGKFLRRDYEGRVAVNKPRPIHVDSFFVDKHEVTNAQFARFLNSVKETDRLVKPGIPGIVRGEKGWAAAKGVERHPVTAATGFGALEYAAWVGGRLPDAAQWEKAAGGAEGKLYPWGDAPPDKTRANFARPKARGTTAVGSFVAGASPYGGLDMAGNAYERVMVPGRGPVMIKGGSWLTPHPLNLRVLDLCMQPLHVADKSVGFRCVMKDPQPDRKTRTKADAPKLRLAKSWEAALAEAKKRNVPVFLSLQFDTCGQCDRIRAQLFKDPRFVAYCNTQVVVAVGHKPGHAGLDPHPERKGGCCPLHEGLECWEHEAIFNKAIHVVGRFTVSPGNFVLSPGARILVKERELPKWGGGAETYIAAFERARKTLSANR